MMGSIEVQDTAFVARDVVGDGANRRSVEDEEGRERLRR